MSDGNATRAYERKLEPARVLIATADELERRYLETCLSEQGYASSWAASGAEALEELDASGLPDLILLDLDLPDHDGVEWLREARAMFGRPLAVIALAGPLSDRARERVLRHGVSRVLTKPVAVEELQRAIRIEFDLRQTRANLE